jgi:hypothetical protein
MLSVHVCNGVKGFKIMPSPHNRKLCIRRFSSGAVSLRNCVLVQGAWQCGQLVYIFKCVIGLLTVARVALWSRPSGICRWRTRPPQADDLVCPWLVTFRYNSSTVVIKIITTVEGEWDDEVAVVNDERHDALSLSSVDSRSSPNDVFSDVSPLDLFRGGVSVFSKAMWLSSLGRLHETKVFDETLLLVQCTGIQYGRATLVSMPTKPTGTCPRTLSSRCIIKWLNDFYHVKIP